MKSRLFFLLAIFFNLYHLLSVENKDFFLNEYDLEILQDATRSHLDLACEKGLHSPYTYVRYSWTYYVEDLNTYADFREGFNYLSWWCASDYAGRIQSILKDIKELQTILDRSIKTFMRVFRSYLKNMPPRLRLLTLSKKEYFFGMKANTQKPS